jgi:hypothetical protein
MSSRRKSTAWISIRSRWLGRNKDIVRDSCSYINHPGNWVCTCSHGALEQCGEFRFKIVTTCDEFLVGITSRFFDSFRILVRLTRVVLTLVCAYVELWTDLAPRMASDDLRWAEKKQNHGVMTTGRRADLERVTGIEPNHDVCPQNHLISKKLDMSSAGPSCACTGSF